ncbi:MAG: hypothetical protein R3222_08225, partial [Balneolaceae bacterium]|nr:hypothetical protein [Balneolaceae bacterium]
MKQPYTLLLLIIIFCFSSTNVFGQDSDSTQWTVEDVIKQENAYSLEFAPDGNSLVWVKRRADKKEDKFINDLYLTRLDVKENRVFKTVQLTRGKESDSSPLFSRDGETIYFLSTRDEGKKLWALSTFGGEPYEVHTFDSGISNIRWLSDNKLAFESNEGKTLYEQKLEEAEDNTVVVEDTAHFKASRIYSFDLKSKDIKRLTDNEYPVGEYQVSKNGRYLVTSHILSPDYGADANPTPTYYLWDLNTGDKRQILQDGYQTPGNFEFTDSNEGFYFVSVKSSDPQWNGAGITMLHYYDLESNTVYDVPVDWDWGLGSGFDLVGNDLIVGLANGATVKLAYLEKTGDGWNKKELDAGDKNEHVSVIAVGKENKKVAYVYSTASTPPQYRLANLEH